MMSSSARFSSVSAYLVVAGTSLAVTFRTAPAAAEFARPPESPHEVLETEPPPPERFAHAEPGGSPSTFRFHVGPAVLIQPGSPGLSTALDIGRRAVGARFSGTWLRAESERGLSSYSAELWINFGHRYELHPILGAGASWLRGGALESNGSRSAGAGVLRGALEYQLPLADADARLGLNVVALVPAIASERSRPWVVTALMIGAGF